KRRAHLRCSLQRCVINVDESEACPVAIRPLEIIHRTPMEITSHGNAFSSRTLQLRKIVAQEHDSVAVIDNTIAARVVGCTATILRDVDVLDVPELHQVTRGPIERLGSNEMPRRGHAWVGFGEL